MKSWFNSFWNNIKKSFSWLKDIIKKPFGWFKRKIGGLKNIRLKKINTFNLVLIIASVLLIGTSSVLFGYSLCSGGLIVASTKQTVSGYYLAEVDCLQDYDKAVELANEVQSRGGAGYIRFDNGWHIFASGYCAKSDAESVVNKLTDYPNACVYTLSVDEFNFDNGFSQNVNQIFKNNIITLKYAIQALDEILIKYDKNEVDIIEVKNVAILSLEEVDQQIDKFADIYYRDTTMIKYDSYIREFRDYINDIITLDLEGYEFSKLIQYQKISCMFSLQKILDLI